MSDLPDATHADVAMRLAQSQKANTTESSKILESHHQGRGLFHWLHNDEPAKYHRVAPRVINVGNGPTLRVHTLSQRVEKCLFR